MEIRPKQASELMSPDALRALPVGSAVLTSGHIVWVKYGEHDGPDAAFEWGRCNRIGGKFEDSDWLAECSPVLLYIYAPCTGEAGHDGN